MARGAWSMMWMLALVLITRPAGAQDTPTPETAADSAATAGEPTSRPAWPPERGHAMDFDFIKKSVYIPVRDGTRLAADIFIPGTDGKPADSPRPVVWSHHRYHRGAVYEDLVYDDLDKHRVNELVINGYVAVAVCGRGTGASYGSVVAPYHPQEVTDCYDVMAWIARQPWCNGTMGMAGDSYMGSSALLAASSGSPHLKAIVAQGPLCDLYAMAYGGGIFRADYFYKWSNVNMRLDTLAPPEPARVDEDPDGSMLASARADHQDNANTFVQLSALPYRDGIDETLKQRLYLECSPIRRVEDINDSGVAVRITTGWFDAFCRDAFTMYANLTGPKSLIVGPWFHSQRHDFDIVQAHKRWYDAWMLDVDNGVKDEPPIQYYTMNGQGPLAGDGEWRTATEWPLPETKHTRFNFHEDGPEPGHGALSTAPSTSRTDIFQYRIVYPTSIGPSNRWSNVYGGLPEIGDLADNDTLGVTHTSAPLAEDLEVTGHPVAHLWISTPTPDVDFFVYLEEVDDEGVSHYVTEGCLRASHRKVNDPPYDYSGVPWHRSHAEDIEPLPKEPLELLVELHPTSNIFNAGNRIRVTVTCADQDTAQTPMLSPVPLIAFYRTPDRASGIVLPVIPAGE